MSGIISTGPIAFAEVQGYGDAHSRFRCACARHRAPHGALHRRHHAGRVRLWRGVADIAGGAGTVASNIASLGARCIFVGLVGEDDAGKRLAAGLAEQAGIESVLVCDPSRPTTRKVRFVSEHFSTHMLRADWELALPASADIEQKLVDPVVPLLPRADIVLLSDYAKG